jgi:hypothetical protein
VEHRQPAGEEDCEEGVCHEEDRDGGHAHGLGNGGALPLPVPVAHYELDVDCREGKHVDAEEGGGDNKDEEESVVPLQGMEECLFVGDRCRRMRKSNLIAGRTFGS